jgi:PAS domain S-box-containing protein
LGSVLVTGILVLQLKWRLRAERFAQELSQSQTALAVTLSSIEDGVITTNLLGCVVSMNPAAERMTGCPLAEGIGQPLAKVFKTVHARSREPRVAPVESVMRVSQATGLDEGTILIARNCTERFIADAASPIRNDDGEHCGMVLVFRDVTEQRKAEERQLKESRLETIGSVAGGIAHDYNNILTILIGNLSLARAQLDQPRQALERLEAVDGAAQRAKDLTQQLLTFARGGAPIKRRIQLESLMREAVEFALHGTKVSSELSIATELWPAEVDEGQFRHALNNLVLYGVRAMPDGGKIEVKAQNCKLHDREISELRGGRYVHIMICDQGRRLNSDELLRIFEPHFSPDDPGSGLGLATAHSVIRKHGGELLARALTQNGTGFEVYLPALEATAMPVPVQKPAVRVQLSGSRVLIMDDEPGIRESLGLLLEVLGLESEAVPDGQEALSRYEAARKSGLPFDAVIMDLTIPNGMGGEEAVRRLKQLDRSARAIVSSGYSNDPVMAQYRRYGFDGVMPKPYHLPQLEEVLNQVLGAEAKTEPLPLEPDGSELQFAL